MREKIKSGEYGKETLTYKEGEPDWLPLEKQDIWEPSFTPRHEVETKDSREWVLLVESPIKKGDFKQEGPYSKEEVLEKVEIGEVHLKDFFWKPGMDGWKPLLENMELGFPRKEQITFDNTDADEKLIISSDLTPKADKLLEPLPELKSDHGFIEKEDISIKGSQEKKPELSRPKLLPPLVDVYGERKEVVVYLFLVAALFLGAFALGSFSSTSILKAIEATGSGMVNISRKVLPEQPRVSYIFLRELPLTKGTILIKTDGDVGMDVVIRLKDEKGRFVKTVQGRNELKLKTNKNGEAFLPIENFQVQNGQNYFITTQAGRLTANKSYLYTNSQ
jgi:hypothetical protein